MSYDTNNSEWSFIPLDENSQNLMCSLIGLPLISKHKIQHKKSLKNACPTKIHKITGDGSCLLRALSYAITGRQIYHGLMRQKILNHMREIENLLHPHMNMPVDMYFAQSRMSNDAVWGNDVEILAASSLLSTDIFVHTKVGSELRWHKFSKSNLDGTHPQNDAAIYIQHTNEVHYDVVLDASTREELQQHVKRKTVGNSVVHEPACKRNKVSIVSKKKCSNIKVKKCISDSYGPKHINDPCVEVKCVFENKVDNEFIFNPNTQNSQNFMCSLIGLPLMSKHKIQHPKMIKNSCPAKIHKITGDGNCLFRALSYAITGRQIYHGLIRQKILNHMREIENLLYPHMNMPVEIYFAQSGMSNNAVWGTDVEILAASSLLSTDIYVQSKVGSELRWHKFSKSNLDGTHPQNDAAIYLQHTNDVHYDVVLDVSTREELQHVKRKTVGNSVVHEPACKRNKVSVTSKEKNNVKEKHVANNELFLKNEKVNINNFHSSMKFSITHCKICKEAWPLNTKSKLKSPHICRRCVLDKQLPKKFSIENFMIPSSVPDILQDLTQIEEMLIARALPIMKVYLKPGGQRGYSGHCINFPQRVLDLAQSLPHCPKDIPLIVVTMKGKGTILKMLLFGDIKLNRHCNG